MLTNFQRHLNNFIFIIIKINLFLILVALIKLLKHKTLKIQMHRIKTVSEEHMSLDGPLNIVLDMGGGGLNSKTDFQLYACKCGRLETQAHAHITCFCSIQVSCKFVWQQNVKPIGSTQRFWSVSTSTDLKAASSQCCSFRLFQILNAIIDFESKPFVIYYTTLHHICWMISGTCFLSILGCWFQK